MQTLRQSAKQLLQRSVLEQLSAAAGAGTDRALPDSHAAWQLCSGAALRLLASSPLTPGARASLQTASTSTRASFSSCQLPSKALQGKPALKRQAWPSCASHALGASSYSTRTSQQGRMQGLSDLQQKKSGEQGLYIIAFVVAMVGVTYASVPLYRMFCQATGYGGTVQQGQTVEEKLRKQAASKDEILARAAAEREMTVSFNADVSDGLPWKFVPCQRSVTLHAGQSTLVFYNAQNNGEKSITGVSTYNVAPQQAGQYFNKIQCFCFEEQRLRAHENIDMPIFFYIDPEFALDPYMKNINHLTLSYTFFKVDDDDGPHDEEDDDSPTVVKTHECVEQQA